MSIKGFGTALGPDTITINGTDLGSIVPAFSSDAYFAGKRKLDVSLACTDAIVQRTMTGASTFTLQLLDPKRIILRSTMFALQDVLAFDGLNFTLVQFAKTGDQLQLVFESSVVANLRQQQGTIVYQASGVGIAAFARQLCQAVGATLYVYGVDPPSSLATAIGRGTTDTTDEDSWTCLNRLATSFGWRCFESEGAVYLGPDTPWLVSLFPGPHPTIREFTDDIQDIDFDWDIGKPLGIAQVTAILDSWGSPPGSPVICAGMGPYASTTFLTNTCQRDFFEPQATIQLQVPMTAAQVLNPDSAGIQNV